MCVIIMYVIVRAETEYHVQCASMFIVCLVVKFHAYNCDGSLANAIENLHKLCHFNVVRSIKVLPY
jgi:hypothetical protein